jgi:hypothetical protein
MVKLTGLVSILTAAQERPEASGTTVVRSLRPAGLISSGGRGPGGADMTDQDATNLLLGMTCSDQAKNAAEAVPLYRGLFGHVTDHKTTGRGTDADPYMSLCPESLRWLSDTAQGLTLGMAIDRLISMAREGKLQLLFRDLAGSQVAQGVPDREARIDRAIDELNMVSLRLDFRRPRPGATISFPPYLTVDFNYQREVPDKRKTLDSIQTGDRTDTTTITHRTIFALGEALRG